MKNEKINQDLNNFLKYLYSIGIINQSAIKDILNHIIQIQTNENYEKLDFVKFSHVILTEYLKSLDNSLIHLISSDIISNYISKHSHYSHADSYNYNDNMNNKNKKKVKNLFCIYSKRRNFILMKHFFFHWKNKRNSQKNKKNHYNNQDDFQYINDYQWNKLNKLNKKEENKENNPKNQKENTENSKNTMLIKNNKDNKQILTTQERQEIEEFKNCTFQPKINKKSKTISRFYNNEQTTEEEQSNINKNITSIDSTFNRLYLDYDRIIKNRNVKKQEIDNRENKLLKSTPSILNSSFSNKIMKNLDFLSKSFIDRQEEYTIKRQKTIQKVRNDNEELDNQVFTFNPVINDFSTKIEYAYPVYDRLYNDNKRRIENANIVQINYEKDIRNKSKSRKNDNNNRLNQNKIEELYQDYKAREIKKKTLLNTINKEEGITFTPKLNQNSKFNNKPLVATDFHKRNEILLQNKKEFIYYMKKLEEEEIDEARRLFPKEKREKIEKEVIERLYKPSGLSTSRTMKSFTNKMSKNQRRTIE